MVVWSVVMWFVLIYSVLHTNLYWTPEQVMLMSKAYILPLVLFSMMMMMMVVVMMMVVMMMMMPFCINLLLCCFTLFQCDLEIDQGEINRPFS